MIKRMTKLVVWVYAFFGLAGVAQAGFLPSGADFGFFTNDLLLLFLAPFVFAGCGGG